MKLFMMFVTQKLVNSNTVFYLFISFGKFRLMVTRNISVLSSLFPILFSNVGIILTSQIRNYLSFIY